MERLAKIGPRGLIVPKPKFMATPVLIGRPRPKVAALPESPPFRKAVVLGATGSVGRELVIELMNRGVEIRAVSRSLMNLRRNFAEGSVEFHEADLRDPSSMFAACEGCDVAFLCAGVPFEEYEQHLAMGRNFAGALTHHKCRGLLVSDCWSYYPIRTMPLREDAIRRGVGKFGKVRLLQEDQVTNAGGGVVILPDFFGPGATNSLINEGIARLARGKKVRWPGDHEAMRDFLFLHDLRPVLVNLAMRKEAFGGRWHVSGSGPITARQLLEMAADRLGARPRVRATPYWSVKLKGKFSEKAREVRDLYPIYAMPAVLDGGAIRKLVGDYRATPYSNAIDRTLRWMTGGVDAEAA
jgi:nucleoside-diphosphate-sugar epimerase